MHEKKSSDDDMAEVIVFKNVMGYGFKHTRLIEHQRVNLSGHVSSCMRLVRTSATSLLAIHFIPN